MYFYNRICLLLKMCAFAFFMGGFFLSLQAISADFKEDMRGRKALAQIQNSEKKERRAPKSLSTPYPYEHPKDFSRTQWTLEDDETEDMFKHSKDLVYLVELGGHFKRLNKMWENKLGWTVQELLKAPYITFMHPEDVEKTLEYEKNLP